LLKRAFKTATTLQVPPPGGLTQAIPCPVSTQVSGATIVKLLADPKISKCLKNLLSNEKKYHVYSEGVSATDDGKSAVTTLSYTLGDLDGDRDDRAGNAELKIFEGYFNSYPTIPGKPKVKQVTDCSFLAKKDKK
jgi:hypothetical protein